MALVLRAATGEDFSRTVIEGVELGFVAVNLVLVGIYVLVAAVRTAAADFAARLLTRGRLGLAFLAGAVGLGLCGTLVLAGIAAATGSTVALALAAVTDLSGHFVMFFVILGVGVYAPPRPRLANVRQHPLAEQA